MDRDRGLKKWYLHTVFQSEAFFYTVIEYLLCARWICSHDHTQCGSFCPHNFPESRILWLWGQRPLQTKLRPKRGASGTPILGSAVRLLKGLEPGTRTLGRQGGGGLSQSPSLWACLVPEILSARLLFSLTDDRLLFWAYGREWLPQGPWFFKSSIQVKLPTSFKCWFLNPRNKSQLGSRVHLSFNQFSKKEVLGSTKDLWMNEWYMSPSLPILFPGHLKVVHIVVENMGSAIY